MRHPIKKNEHIKTDIRGFFSKGLIHGAVRMLSAQAVQAFHFAAAVFDNFVQSPTPQEQNGPYKCSKQSPFLQDSKKAHNLYQ